MGPTAAGPGMRFAAYGQRVLAAFPLLAALYHVASHGVSKTLLFLEAGVIEHSTATLDMDRLGGLIHRLRASIRVPARCVKGVWLEAQCGRVD